MEEDLLKLDALFDSIIDDIIHPEKAGTFKNPFIERKTSKIAELADAVTVIMVTVSEDGMTATCTVFSKEGEHKTFTVEDIMKSISENRVFYGIDEAAVKDMVEKQLLNTEVVVASGLPPVNGADGSLRLKYDDGLCQYFLFCFVFTTL